MFNQCKHTLCLHFASRGGVRPCKAAMACASSVQAGHSLPQVCKGEGLLCLSRAVTSWSACNMSKFDLWLPPTLEMSQGIIVWPFVSLLWPVRPFGCSSLDVFYLSGTFLVPFLHWSSSTIHTSFFLIHFWGLSSLFKPAREMFGVNLFPTSQVRLIVFK